MQLKLTIIKFPADISLDQMVREFDDDVVTFGRSKTNTWPLPDPDRYLSGSHCQIKREGSQYYLIDCSTNGTFLNRGGAPVGKNAGPVLLKSGSVIGLGDYEIQVDIPVASSAMEMDDAIFSNQLKNNDGIISSDPFAASDDFSSILTTDKPSIDDILFPDDDAAAAEFLKYNDGILGAENPLPNQGSFGASIGASIDKTPSIDDLLFPEAEANPDPLADLASKSADSFMPTQGHQGDSLGGMMDLPTAKSDQAGIIPEDWDIFSDFEPPATLPKASKSAVAPIPQPKPALASTPQQAPKPQVSPPILQQQPEVAMPPAVPILPAAEFALPLGPMIPEMPPMPPPVVSAPPPVQPAAPVRQQTAPVQPAATLQQQQTEFIQPAVPERKQAAPVQPAITASATQSGVIDYTIIKELGLDHTRLSPEQITQINQLTGKLLQATIRGLMEVLSARSSIKNEFRMGVTTIQPKENNPLKFSATVDDAIDHMFLRSGNAYLPPLRAIEESFQSIAEHQIAVIAGIRSAFMDVVKRFDPVILEAQFAKWSKSGLLPAMRKAKNWDMFGRYYQELISDTDSAFQEIFGDSFVVAYEDQLQKLAAARLQQQTKS